MTARLWSGWSLRAGAGEAKGCDLLRLWAGLARCHSGLHGRGWHTAALERWHAGTHAGRINSCSPCRMRAGPVSAAVRAVASSRTRGRGFASRGRGRSGVPGRPGLVVGRAGPSRRPGRDGGWCGARGHAGTLVCTQAMGNRNKQHGERTAGSYLSRTCRLARRGSPPPAYTICAALRRVAGGLRAIRIL